MLRVYRSQKEEFCGLILRNASAFRSTAGFRDLSETPAAERHNSNNRAWSEVQPPVPSRNEPKPRSGDTMTSVARW